MQRELLQRTKDEKNGKERLRSCRDQTTFDSLKIPQLQSRIWNGVKLVVLFIGYYRSGHSLVAALLDAHPNIILADEADAMRTWLEFPNETKTRDNWFQILYERSYKLATIGERGTGNCYSQIGYKYHVPNQWQGRFDGVIQVRLLTILIY